MRRLLLAALLLISSLSGTEAMASVVITPPVCSAGTFDTYTSLTTGCTIGTYLFSDFALNSSDSASFDPSQIFVSPYLTGTQAGLDFTLSGPADGILRLAPISYIITGLDGSTISGADLGFTGAPGPAEVDQNQCLNGLFVTPPGGVGTTCTGTSSRPITIVDQGESPNPSGTDFDPSSTVAVMTDASSLPPFSSTDSFGARGISDAADPVLFSFGSHFTIGAVPEPAPVLLLAIGFFTMAGIRRMRRSA